MLPRISFCALSSTFAWKPTATLLARNIFPSGMGENSCGKLLSFRMVQRPYCEQKHALSSFLGDPVGRNNYGVLRDRLFDEYGTKQLLTDARYILEIIQSKQDGACSVAKVNQKLPELLQDILSRSVGVDLLKEDFNAEEIFIHSFANIDFAKMRKEDLEGELKSYPELHYKLRVTIARFFLHVKQSKEDAFNVLGGILLDSYDMDFLREELLTAKEWYLTEGKAGAADAELFAKVVNVLDISSRSDKDQQKIVNEALLHVRALLADFCLNNLSKAIAP